LVKSIKFLLGLYLKSNLDWEKEINAVVRKCENMMKIVNCVKHAWWGATVMDILSENSKKECPKISYRALKARGKIIYARQLLCHKRNS
jgi:hypothetical protein